MTAPRPAAPVRDPWHASARGIAVTALGLAAIVGLVAWPLPTAYALCAATGLLALTAGVLMLRGELTHRADEPAEDACVGCAGCGGPDCIQRPEPDACPTCGHRGA